MNNKKKILIIALIFLISLVIAPNVFATNFTSSHNLSFVAQGAITVETEGMGIQVYRDMSICQVNRHASQSSGSSLSIQNPGRSSNLTNTTFTGANSTISGCYLLTNANGSSGTQYWFYTRGAGNLYGVNPGVSYPINANTPYFNWSGCIINDAVANNCAFSVVSIIWDDGVSPNPVSFVDPTPINNTINYFSNNSINIRTNSSIILGNTTINFYNSTGGLIYSASNNSNYTVLNISGLNIGLYRYNATFNNGSITNFTETRIFTVYNLTASNITIPLNNSNISRILNINWTNATSGTSVNISNYTIFIMNNNSFTLNRTLGTVSNLSFWGYDTFSNNLDRGSYYIKILASDGLNNKMNSTLILFNIVTDAELNVTAFSFNGTQITTFNISVNGTSYGTTSGIITVGIMKNSSYNISIDAPGFSLNSTIYQANSSSFQMLNFSLYPSNAIFFFIFNESSGLPVFNLTSVAVVNPMGFYSGSSNGSGVIVISNISPGNYTATFTNSLFSIRQVYVEVEDRSYQFVNVYLLQNGTALLLNTKNTGGNVLSGVYCNMRTYVNASITSVSSGVSDVSGQLQFVVASNKYYDFNCSLSGYSNNFFFLDPVKFSSYDVPLSPSGSGSVTPTGFAVWSPNYFKTRTNNQFTIEFLSPYDSFANYSFALIYPNGTVNGSGNNSYGEEFARSFSMTGLASDRVYVYYNFTLTNGVFQSFNYSYPVIIQTTNTTLSTVGDRDFGFLTGDKVFIVFWFMFPLMAVAWLVGGFYVSLTVGGFVLMIFNNNGFLSIQEQQLFLVTGIVIVLLIIFRGK